MNNKSLMVMFSVLIVLTAVSVAAYADFGSVYAISIEDRIEKLQNAIQEHLDRIQILEDKKNDLDVRIERIQSQVDSKQAIIDSLNVTSQVSIEPEPEPTSTVTISNDVAVVTVDSEYYNTSGILNVTVGFLQDILDEDVLKSRLYPNSTALPPFDYERVAIKLWNDVDPEGYNANDFTPFCSSYRYYDGEEWGEWEGQSSFYDGETRVGNCFVVDDMTFGVTMELDDGIDLSEHNLYIAHHVLLEHYELSTRGLAYSEIVPDPLSSYIP